MFRQVCQTGALFILLVIFSPKAFGKVEQCADASFKLYYGFAEESKLLQEVSQAGNIEARNKRVDTLFDILVNLKDETIACPDRRLPPLFQRAVNFLFLFSKDDRLLDLYQEFLKTDGLSNQQSAEYADSLYRMHWQARKFDSLPVISANFDISDDIRAKYPAMPTKPDSVNQMLLAAEFGQTGEILFNRTGLASSELQIVVVIELACDFSRNLIAELKKDPQLFNAKKNINFVLPQASQASPYEVARLNNDLGEFNVAYVNDEELWPSEIFFHQYPTFYFLYNNKVVEQIHGWPSLDQAKLVNDTYSRLSSDLY